MRARVASLTIGLPRSARDTVGWDTPARCAITSDVAFSLLRMVALPTARCRRRALSPCRILPESGSTNRALRSPPCCAAAFAATRLHTYSCAAEAAGSLHSKSCLAVADSRAGEARSYRKPGSLRRHAACRHRRKHRRRLRRGDLRPGALGVARPRAHLHRLLPRLAFAAVVGDRRLADRRQHLRRADRRHVGIGLRDRSRHRLLRMDGSVDPGDRRQVVPADLPQEPHRHHAAVPERRYGARLRTLMAVFWLALYVFVNLTSILWLGSIAVNRVAGVDQDLALVALGLFALCYQLAGGLRAVALTDIVQVSLLVLGGLLVSGITLARIGEGAGIAAGFAALVARAPEHFHMILGPDDPHYKELPGLSVLLGGMWIANLSYWGCNQYIVQRALAAKSLAEAQKGVIFAAYLKLLMPLVIVLPGIAAVVLAPDLPHADQAYPAMLRLLPPGLVGLVFAALIAAVVASTASKINSIATIFTLDIYAKLGAAKDERRLVVVGRLAACAAILLAILSARPLLGSFDQAFQYIQEYTGFFTPGIVVIFLLGLFWPRATEAGALAAAAGSFVLSIALKALWPSLPFLDRMGLVFLLALAAAVAISLRRPTPHAGSRIDTRVDYRTSPAFNLGALGVIAILTALYAVWW